MRIALALLLAFASPLTSSWAQTGGDAPQHAFFCISLGPGFAGPVSGRLLLFLAPAGNDAKDARPVDIDMMSPTSVYVAAKEIRHLAAGGSVDVDADDVVGAGVVTVGP